MKRKLNKKKVIEFITLIITSILYLVLTVMFLRTGSILLLTFWFIDLMPISITYCDLFENKKRKEI